MKSFCYNTVYKEVLEWTERQLYMNEINNVLKFFKNALVGRMMPI